MIICPNCSRENEDHYKFCLGCGTELSKARAEQAGAPAVARPVPVATALPRATPVARPSVDRVLPRVATAPPEPRAPREPSSEAPPVARPAVAVPASRPSHTPPAFSAVRAAPAPVVVVAAPAAEPESAETSGPPTAEGPEVEPEAPPAPDVGTDLYGSLPPEPDVDAVEPTAMMSAPSPDVFEIAAEPAPADDLPFDVGSEAAADPADDGGVSTEPPMAAPAVEQPEEEEPVGGSIEGLPPPRVVSRPASGRICGSCGAAVPEGFKFCGVCGTRYDGERPVDVFVPHVHADAASPARLVLIHPDGSEGEVFPLGVGETTVGRGHPSALFADDPFLSPRHATFYFVKGQLFVRDEGSLNGVFLRIKAEVELFHGDMFRIGQQLLRFEEMSQVRPVLPGAGDGTIVMGSPVRGAWGRLSSIVALETPAMVWVLRKTEDQLGRERGDIVFPEDGFVSGAHCKLATREGRFFLHDLDSTNGTYLRIKGEGILAKGDLILLGQQLFKVEIG